MSNTLTHTHTHTTRYHTYTHINNQRSNKHTTLPKIKHTSLEIKTYKIKTQPNMRPQTTRHQTHTYTPIYQTYSHTHTIRPTRLPYLVQVHDDLAGMVVGVYRRLHVLTWLHIKVIKSY